MVFIWYFMDAYDVYGYLDHNGWSIMIINECMVNMLLLIIADVTMMVIIS